MSDLSHVDSLRVMTTSIAEGADQGKLSIGISGAGDESGLLGHEFHS